MVSYKVQVTFDAKEDLKRYSDYLRLEKRSPIAAKSIVTDFKNTISQLKLVADSLQIPESEELHQADERAGVARLSWRVSGR